MLRASYTYRLFQGVLPGILLLWVVLPAFGQPGPVWIELAPGASTEAEPGRPLTLAFTVANTSDTDGSFTDAFVLPDGWRTILDATSFALDAGAQTIRIVTVVLPERTHAGTYEMTYRVLPADRAGDGGGELVIPITLPVRYEIALEPLEAPRFAVSGMVFTATFLLENKGNTPVTVSLDFNKQERWTVEADFEKVRLAPAEARTVSVETRSPTLLGPRSYAGVSVLATVEENPETTAKARANPSVLPRLQNAKLAYHTYEAEVGLSGGGFNRSVTQGAEPILQLLASGNGTLKEDSETDVRFDIRSPSLVGGDPTDFFFLRDAYLFRVTNPSFDVTVGDYGYSLTPLSSVSVLGFGVGGQVRLGRFETGGHVLRTRFGVDRRQAGFKIGVRPFSSVFTGVNVLTQTGFIDGDIVTTRTVFNPSDKLLAEAEYGRGRGASGEQDYGVRFRLSSTLPHNAASLNAQFLATGAAFPSFNGNSRQFWGSAGLSPLRQVSLSAIWRYDERGPRLLSDAIRDRRTQSYELRLRYGSWLKLRGIRRRRQNIQTLFPRDQAENALALDATVGRRTASLTASVVAGRLYDRVGKTSRATTTLGLRGKLQPSYRFSLNARIEHNVGGNISTVGSPITPRWLLGSLGLFWRPTSRTQIQLSAAAQRFTFSSETLVRTVNAGFSQELPWGHQLAVDGFYEILKQERFADTERWQVFMTYTVPLRIKLKKSRKTGMIRGTLIDEETGAGLGGVPVFLRQGGAVTNEHGEFYLPLLPPGEHAVMVEPKSLGPNRILRQQPPFSVAVEGGEIAHLDLTATTASEVFGQVVREVGSQFFEAPDEAPTAVEALAGVVIELTGEDVRTRRVTDAAGRFHFGGLASGAYTLRVLTAYLPEQHTVDQAVRTVDLEAGERHDVKIQVRPRRRTIRLIETEPVPRKGGH